MSEYYYVAAVHAFYRSHCGEAAYAALTTKILGDYAGERLSFTRSGWWRDGGKRGAKETLGCRTEAALVATTAGEIRDAMRRCGLTFVERQFVPYKGHLDQMARVPLLRGDASLRERFPQATAVIVTDEGQHLLNAMGYAKPCMAGEVYIVGEADEAVNGGYCPEALCQVSVRDGETPDAAARRVTQEMGLPASPAGVSL